jgi:citrate synthase
MTRNAAWITAREAARQLDIKLATLYAYTSRGLITSVPAATGRGRRYAQDAVERLKARHDARAGHGVVAAAALRFGEPTLETGICEIRADGPYYRGHEAVALAAGEHSFESICDLLWTGRLGEPAWPAHTARIVLPRRRLATPGSRATKHASATPISLLAAAVSCAALTDDERHGASTLDEHRRARRLIRALALLTGGRARRLPARGSVAQLLLLGLGVVPTARSAALVERALILCADHELNPSTFATRIAASTGADLYACLGCGLQALSGPRHGGVTARVEALLREVTGAETAARVVRERNMRGEEVPGFGHPLYPAGDPRGRALLALAREALDGGPRGRDHLKRARSLLRSEAVVTAMHRAQHPGPNLDLGLVALCQALGLPDSAAAAVFAIGRLAGWVAHALEQRGSPYVLRPRARYVAARE